MSVLNIIPYILALLVVFFYIRPSKLSGAAKCLLLFAVLINVGVSWLYAVYKLTPAELGFSRLPSLCIEAIVYSVNFLALFTLARIILYFVFSKIKSGSAVLFAPDNLKGTIAILCASFLICITACFNSTLPPELKHYEFSVKGLPVQDRDFVIVHLSDLHISAVTPDEDIADIVNRVNALNPDVIAVTGDLLDGRADSVVAKKVSLLFSLHSKYGVFAVSGNHELYWGYKEWLGFLSAGGIRFLENESTVIKDESGQGILNICGITDKKAALYNVNRPDVKKALEHIDKALPVLALSHRPVYAKKFADSAFLTLSGHTHGGLMPVLEVLALITNSGLVHDHYKIGESDLIVSRGTMISMAGPLRLFNDAQIGVVTLTSF